MTSFPQALYSACVFVDYLNLLSMRADMLSKKTLVRMIRWLWFVFLVLSPLAYIAGVILFLNYSPLARLGLSYDREEAGSIAARYASTKGVDVTGWDKFFRFKPNQDHLFYYRLKSGSDRDLARLLAHEAVFGVRFRSPDRKESLEVLISPDGRPLGFSRCLSKAIEVKDAGEELSRKLAEDALKARLLSLGMSHPIDLKPADVKADQCYQDSTAVRSYRWRWPLPSLPELELQSVITVRGETLVGDQVEAKIDGDFAKKYLHSKSLVYRITVIIYCLIFLVVLIFGIYRFIQRAQQKEVSYSRALLLTLVFASVTSGFVLLTDVSVYEISGIPDFPAPDWTLFFFTSMVYLLAGLFLGLAYGSGEGDIREAYPGKLSSLDALLTGKVFSRNVARSVVVGWGIGGWIILLFNMVALPWLGEPASGEELDPIDGWLGRAPSLYSYTLWPTDVILTFVIGLLIPLPFFYRRFKSTKTTIALFAVFMWVACSIPYMKFRPWRVVLAMTAVKALLLMLAFFRFDLLTSIVALAVPTFVYFTFALIAQPSPSLRQSGLISIGFALTVLAIEAFFAVKGRIYSEDEVRPVYAKHLAERLSMQAEVTAAREAQQRLMPNVLPKTPYFSIAASCVPAFDVGGDFYDLFEREPGKLGVLVAEGGGNGLGSALSIAFAKGYMMPKIMRKAQCDDSPSEVIRGLQDRLMTRTFDDAGTGFIFALIDATDGTLRYARTGDYPSVMVNRKTSPNQLMTPHEHELKFKSNLSVEKDVQLIEGSFQLNTGDSVIFFTDGMVKELANSNSSTSIEFTKVLSNSRDESDEHLQETLTKSVNECSKRARRRGLEDDLTAVIVRLRSQSSHILNAR